MSKKTAREAAAAPDTPASPQSTEALSVQLPCAQKYFFAYALQCWGNCRSNSDAFAEESDLYTVEFIDTQEALVKTVQKLPNNEVRLGGASLVRLQLEAARQSVVQNAERLRIAIRATFKATAMAEVELSLAGLTAFASTSPTDWGTTADFITTANSYLTAKGSDLVKAKALKTDFSEKFKAAGEAFEAAWADYRAKKQSAGIGTTALAEGLQSILDELNPMMKIGRNHFKYDATLRKLFTVNDVVDEVRRKHLAAIVGNVVWEGKPLVAANVQVVDQPDKFAVTDAQGRYEIGIAAGTYDLLFTADGMEPLTVTGHKVRAGVRGRLNVELVPMPVEVAPVANREAAPTPFASEPIGNSPLAKAMSEMLEKASVNGKANGVAA